MHVTPAGWVYFAGVVVSFRFIAGADYRTSKDGPVAAAFTGFFAAWFWPLILTVWLIYKACLRWPDGMHRIFIHETSQARRERKLARARERVTQLERELDL